MASLGFYSLSTSLATLSPLRPRKVCTSPGSFQWRARRSRHHLYSAVITGRHELLLVNTVVKRPFSGGGCLCKLSGASGEGSFTKKGLPDTNSAENTEEDCWGKELPVPGRVDSTIVNGAVVVDRVEISAQVRKAMRSVPQPVSIITSTDVSTGTPVFRGATISSFNTVTIEPSTIVSLNIKRPSSTFDAIESSGHFLVHLLNADQTTSEVAQAFTKGSSTAPFHTLKKVFQDRLQEVSGQAAMANAGPPLIEDCSSPGRLLCQYLPQKTVQLGDHVVVFGIVDKVTRKLTSLEESDITCLAYANGQYGCVSPLDHSSAPKISSTAFDEFVLKLRFMDHSCLSTFILSDPYLDLLEPGLNASFRRLRFKSEDLFDFLTRDATLNSGSRPMGVGLETRPMSSLSTGILEGVTFYSIFLTSMHGTDFTMFEVPHIPQEALEALQEYQTVIRETYDELVSIRVTLQRLHDPQSPYQPPVSDVYSLERLLSGNLGENLRYLNMYIRCCLTPLALPETITTAKPVLQPLVTQYNATVRENLRWIYYQAMYNHAYRTDDLFQIQPHPAHVRARTALMRIRAKDILLSWAEWPAKKPDRLQKMLEDFQGLRDELMPWLRQYGSICETTGEYLNSYKAFLRTSELYNYERDELGLSTREGPARRVANTVSRKWFGRGFITPKVHTSKKGPLVKRYMRNDGTGIARKVPGPLLTRKAVVEPSPNEPAEDEVRVKFMDPLARRLVSAERQEESIQRGLEDIEKLMADELRQGPKSSRSDALDGWFQRGWGD